MMEDKKLRMNLQYFAEDPKPDVDPEDGTGGESSAENGTDPVVSVAEMQRRLAKAQQVHGLELAQIQAQTQKQIDDAVEKAKNEATLTGQELEKYKQQEAQRKLDELIAENEQLRLDNQKRDLKDEAIRTLSEKKMPVDEKVLNFVVKDTAEDTLQAIDDMAELFNKLKEEFAQTTPPRTSGGMGGNKDSNKSNTDILDGAKITKY